MYIYLNILHLPMYILMCGCLYTYLNVCTDIAYMHMHTYDHTYIYRNIHVCNKCIYIPTYTYICLAWLPTYMYRLMHIHVVYTYHSHNKFVSAQQ